MLLLLLQVVVVVASVHDSWKLTNVFMQRVHLGEIAIISCNRMQTI